MCGIAGIINNNKKVHVYQIKAMCDLIKHRGPDGEGYLLVNSEVFPLSSTDTSAEILNSNLNYSPVGTIDNYIDKDADLLFGHRRLSIIDLSISGHQPLSIDNNRFWMTFNGEIYNYIEIRNELEDLGVKFYSNSDTEVVLSAYKQWGVDCLNRFNGMWAFAIYDHLNKDVFISRDRFGIKPFYYYISHDGSFCFASEIKQFTAIEGWEARMNHQRVFDFLAYALTDHTEETMFKDVFQLRPGYAAKFNIFETKFISGQKISQYKWYNIKKNVGRRPTFIEASNNFKALFNQAVGLCLRSDVEVGAALSGGLDSSSIVCEIENVLKEKGSYINQKTFSSCSLDERYDERKWIDIVIAETSVIPYFVYPEGKDVFKLTDTILWHLDEPYQSQSAFLGYHVFQCAALQGVKVILNGQGADEYLSGYGAFNELRIFNYLKNLKLLNIFEESNKWGLGALMKLFLRFKFPKIIQKLNIIFRWRLRGISDKINLEQLDCKHYLTDTNIDKATVFSIAEKQLLQNPLPRYLRWEDRNSMAHSVEARVPFLDYNLVEYCTQLPIDFLDGKDEKKKLLLHALKELLPKRILNRKDKKGFITPEERWWKIDYTNEFKDEIIFAINNSYNIVKHEALNKFEKMTQNDLPFDLIYWRIILFAKWIRIFDVKY